MTWTDSEESGSKTAGALLREFSEDETGDEYVREAASCDSSDEDAQVNDVSDHDLQAFDDHRKPDVPGDMSGSEFAPTALYGGNLYHPEYYLKQKAMANVKKYHVKNYAPSFVRELNRTLDTWKLFCFTYAEAVAGYD